MPAKRPAKPEAKSPAKASQSPIKTHPSLKGVTTLEACRKKIDAVDTAIVNLLDERARQSGQRTGGDGFPAGLTGAAPVRRPSAAAAPGQSGTEARRPRRRAG